MNARGISEFNDANDSRVAIAGVRPPIGSQVMVGCFEITRPLRLLDLNALSDVTTVGSIFDSHFSKRLEHAMFMRSQSRRITGPVIPDEEALDYLPMQAIADFLAKAEVLP